LSVNSDGDATAHVTSTHKKKEPEVVSGAIIESTGKVSSEVPPLLSPPSLGKNKGPVAEALYNAKAELANQIVEHSKAKGDTMIALTRAMEDKSSKESDLAEAFRLYEHYLLEHTQLTAQIAKSTATISALTELSETQQAEIERLNAAHEAKHNAAKTADDLETLVGSLKDHMIQKEAVKASTDANHKLALEDQNKECEAAFTKFDTLIANITSQIAEAKAEHDLLTELHTATSCADKEAKSERICKRCTGSEKPCGDTCVAESETCHHDAGCACRDESAPAGASFIELGSSGVADPHPLKKQIADAKAELRKIIATHQASMDSLRASITINEENSQELEGQKTMAIADYDRALKTLADEKKSLEDSHAVAKTTKLANEEGLRDAESKGTKAIAALTAQLQESIGTLTDQRKRQQESRAEQVTTCEENRKGMLITQSNAIGALDAELSQLDRQKSDAEKDLETLAAQHGVADASGADQGTDSADQGTADADQGTADADQGTADADQGAADADQGAAGDGHQGAADADQGAVGDGDGDR
jgi:hypothetical protein